MKNEDNYELTLVASDSVHGIGCQIKLHVKASESVRTLKAL